MGPASAALDSTPSGMSLRPPLPSTVRIAPAESLLQCRPKRNSASRTGHGHSGGPGPAPGSFTTPVHHRSPPSVTPWKTQCAQSILATAECPSMERQGIDRVWHWSCAGLGAHSGQPGGCSRRSNVAACGGSPAFGRGSSPRRASLWLAPIDRNRWDRSG